MEVVTIRFDEVYDVRRMTGKGTAPRRTAFSFGSGNQYTAGVLAPGAPRVESGMSVRAVLRKPGSWATLVGWRDMETGELAAPDPGWHGVRMAFFGIWGAASVGLMWPFGADPRAHWLGPLAFVAIALVFVALEYRGFKRARDDVKALKELLPAPDTTG